MINIQPIEKADHRSSGELEVHSMFATIQGEGPFCGEPSVFVRLAGCNLQCPGCDTEYSASRSVHAPLEIADKIEHLSTPNRLVVITGGEPFRQNIAPLVVLLLGKGYRVQIETNGTLPPPLTDSFPLFVSTDTSDLAGCFIVCSPKTGKVNPKLIPLICAYKYVVTEGDIMGDGLPAHALGHSATPFVARPNKYFSGKVYIQPCDEKNADRNAKNLEACIASSMFHGYTLQLQIHKLINME